MCPQLECGVQHIVKCRMVTSAFPGIAQKWFLALLNTLVQIFTHHVMDFGAKARQIHKTQRHPLPGRSVRGVVATDDEPSIEPLVPRPTCESRNLPTRSAMPAPRFLERKPANGRCAVVNPR